MLGGCHTSESAVGCIDRRRLRPRHQPSSVAGRGLISGDVQDDALPMAFISGAKQLNVKDGNPQISDIIISSTALPEVISY